MKQAMGAVLALTLFAGCFFCACDSGNQPDGTDQDNTPPVSQTDKTDRNDKDDKSNQADKTDKTKQDDQTGTVGQSADQNTAVPSRHAGHSGSFRYQGTNGRKDLTAGRYERQLDRAQRSLDHRNLMT